MSANTRLVVDENLGRLARLSDLNLQATSLVAQKKRDGVMIDNLIKALQLFKENRLGHVFSFAPGDHSVFMKQFREKIDQFGEARVYRDFVGTLKGKGLIDFPVESFRELLGMTPIRLQRIPGFGKGSLARLEFALDKEGLHLGMTPEKIEAIFGSGQVSDATEAQV